MKNLTIGDLELLSGIKAHTIRTWEKRYNFLAPERSETNFRYYDSTHLRSLLNTALLNKSGSSISSIANLPDNEVNARLEEACTTAVLRYGKLLNTLILNWIEGETGAFTKALDQAFKLNESGDLIAEVILPFLEKIQYLDHSEHKLAGYLMFAILKTKLFTTINFVQPQDTLSKSVVVYATCSALTELVLLSHYYLLKEKGFNVQFLQTSDYDVLLPDVLNTFKPDILVLGIDSKKQNRLLEKLLRDAATTHKTQIVVYDPSEHVESALWSSTALPTAIPMFIY